MGARRPLPGFQNFVVGGLDAVDHYGVCESFCYCFAGGGSEATGELRIFEQVGDFCGEIFRGAWLGEEPVFFVSDDFGDAASASGYDGKADAHGVEDAGAETFEVGGDDEEIGGGIEGGEIDVSGEVDMLVEVEICGEGFEVVFEFAGAGYDQAEVCLLLFEDGGGIKKGCLIFVVGEGGGVYDKGLAGLGSPVAGKFFVAGFTAVGIATGVYSAVDDMDVFRGYSRLGEDVFNGMRYGDVANRGVEIFAS